MCDLRIGCGICAFESHKEFAAKLGIVSEEADECVFWLRRISNADIKSTIATTALLNEAEELARIFCASARTARRRRGRGYD